jgi:hypothetical protein
MELPFINTCLQPCSAARSLLAKESPRQSVPARRGAGNCCGGNEWLSCTRVARSAEPERTQLKLTAAVAAPPQAALPRAVARSSAAPHVAAASKDALLPPPHHLRRASRLPVTAPAAPAPMLPGNHGRRSPADVGRRRPPRRLPGRRRCLARHYCRT